MRKRVILKTVSPVHVGGKTQELTPLEAVINQGYCYVVDESKMGRELLKKDMMDCLYTDIDQAGRNFQLERFLQQVKLLNTDFLQKSAAYSSATRLRSTPRRLRPFVRDAWNCPFIPGSSIKGVLRTAVMYGVLKRMKEKKPEDFKRFLVNEVKKKLREFNNADEWKRRKPWFKDKIKRNIAGAIEGKLMQNYELPLHTNARRGTTSQQRDIMRAVKVSDTTPLDKDSLSLEEVQVLSLTKGNEVYLKTQLFTEVIPPGAEMEFSITLDENILSDFSKKTEKNGLPYSSMEDLLSFLNEFTTDLWQFEKSYWGGVYGPGSSEMQEFYQQERAAMRLGWGSGLGGASLLMLLPEELRRELRDSLFEPRGQYEFPKSRRAVMDGDSPRWPLGWVTISIY